MKVLAVLLLTAAILLLTGCGEESQSDKSEISSLPTSMGEITKLGEIPSFMGEGLTPERKAELKEQILPPGSRGCSNSGRKI